MIQYEKINDDLNLPINSYDLKETYANLFINIGIIALKSYYLYVVQNMAGLMVSNIYSIKKTLYPLSSTLEAFMPVNPEDLNPI